MTTIADHLWQSTLVAGAAAALTLLLRTNRADVRHAIWLAASLKFLIPFAALIAVGRRLGLGPQAAALPVADAPIAAAVHDSLAGLEPGRYECQVTVLDPGGSKAAFWRAPIVVVP